MDDAWLEPGKWDTLYETGAFVPDEAEVWVGVDIGLRHDTSAVTVIHQRDDEKWVVEARVWTPPEGGEVSLAEVEGHIMDLHNKFNVRGVVYDRWAFSRSAQELEARGAYCIEFPMTNERTVPACSRLLEAINRGELVHNGNTELEAHVQAGTVKMTERGARITKGKPSQGGKKIDALIALLLAFTVANDSDGGNESIYEQRDLVTL